LTHPHPRLAVEPLTGVDRPANVRLGALGSEKSAYVVGQLALLGARGQGCLWHGTSKIDYFYNYIAIQ
jgi:hypothetical protein